jgi:signal transduction histidine kinase
MSGDEDLPSAAAVAEATAELMSAGDRECTLERAVHLAAELVPGAEHISITLLDEAGPSTVATTDRTAVEVDMIQYEVGQGPCLDAARTGDAVLSSDIAEDTRWHDFRARMIDRTDVRSMFSVPLGDTAELSGSLNLSSPRKAAFPAPSRAMASALATVAGARLAAAAALERAVLRVARLEEFAAGLGYDLRSGMTVALAATEVLERRRLQFDQPGREALDLLIKELHSQARLLRELLELGPDRSRHPRMRSVPLVPVLEQVLHRRPHQVVEVQSGAAGAAVAVHPARLRSILTSLLDNADRRGGVTGIEVGMAGAAVWVAVDDAGPGVPTDRRDGYFTGLRVPPRPGAETVASPPLAWTWQYARTAGADLTVEDRPGGGTRFRLVLPLADAAGSSP